MLHVDLPIDTQVTSELSPNNCFIHKTKGYVHQTRPRKETRHLATCFAHTYRSPLSAMVSGRLGAMSRMEVCLHQA